MLEEDLPVLSFVNNGLKEPQVCKVAKFNISVDQRILFLRKNIFTADYLVFAFVI